MFLFFLPLLYLHHFGFLSFSLDHCYLFFSFKTLDFPVFSSFLMHYQISFQSYLSTTLAHPYPDSAIMVGEDGRLLSCSGLEMFCQLHIALLLFVFIVFHTVFVCFLFYFLHVWTCYAFFHMLYKYSCSDSITFLDHAMPSNLMLPLLWLHLSCICDHLVPRYPFSSV